jgi:ATP/maltotriose-dependent transcriptional regulator MalT
MELPRGVSIAEPAAVIEKKKDLYRDFGLSWREIEIVSAAMSPLSAKELAAKLFIAEKTVKFHFTRIYKKLGVKTRKQMIFFVSDLLKDKTPED